MNIQLNQAIIESESHINKEIIRCLNCLYSTIAGTCALDRDFGISIECIDQPLPIAKNLYALDVTEKTKKYENRVNVIEVTFEVKEEKMIPHIKIELNEEEEVE